MGPRKQLKPGLIPAAVLVLLGLTGLRPERMDAAETVVRNAAELRAALRRLQPGDVLSIASGDYGGGFSLRGVAGTQEAPVVISGRDPQNPPVFSEASLGWQLSDCRHVILRHLAVRNCRSNGINVDDGGSYESPAHHIVLEDLEIREIGPRGNHDGLKLSGVDDFVVRRCRFDGWGGSAIDMVGCHRGLIEECTFRGRDGFSQANGVQMKGGSDHINVRTSFFHNAGQRAINLGGSTGLRFFRPLNAKHEARDITIAGNRFVGSLAAVAWVTADGGHVHHNTIVFPERWVLRILQETQNPRFPPCRGGTFENNLIVFDRRVRAFVNVGPGTAAETFKFHRNAWHQVDGNRRPALPTPETEGLYQIDPQLSQPISATMRIESKDPRLRGVGADGYERPEAPRSSPDRRSQRGR